MMKILFLILFLTSSAWSSPTPSTVYIFVHGLYEDITLFEPLNQFFKDRGEVTVNVQLAGHGSDSSQGYRLNFHSWFKQMDSIVYSATLHGEKIIFITHSLGSVLAFDQALSGKNIFKIIAVEPGLEINKSLTNSACALKSIIPDGKKFVPIVRAFLNISQNDRPIPLNLACEAGKIKNYMIEKYLSPSSPISDLGIHFPVPLLIINNLNDLAVNAQVNQTFFYNVPKELNSVYTELNESHLPHGAYVRVHSLEFRDEIIKFIESPDLGPISHHN